MRSEWVRITAHRGKFNELIFRLFIVYICYLLIKVTMETDSWTLRALLSSLTFLFILGMGFEKSIRFNRVSHVLLTSSTLFGLQLKKKAELPICDFSYLYLKASGHDGRGMWRVTLFSVKHPEMAISVAFSDKERASVEAERLSQLFGLPNRGFLTFEGGFSQ